MTSKSTKSLVWTQELANEALKNNQYLKIVEGGKLTNTKLGLSGAKQRWKSNPTDVYLPTLRVAGSEADVKTFLASIGKSNTELTEGFTAKSVEGKAKQRYQQELDQTKKIKGEGINTLKSLKATSESEIKAKKGAAKKAATTKKTEATKSVATVQEPPIVKRVASPRLVSAPVEPPKIQEPPKPQEPPMVKKVVSPKQMAPVEAAQSTKKTTKSTRNPVSLQEKYNALEQDKYLDVSKLKLEGTGSVTTKAPAKDSKRIHIPGLRLVADTPEQLAMAVSQMSPQVKAEFQPKIDQLLHPAPVPRPASPRLVPMVAPQSPKLVTPSTSSTATKRVASPRLTSGVPQLTIDTSNLVPAKLQPVAGSIVDTPPYRGAQQSTVPVAATVIPTGNIKQLGRKH